MVRKEDFHKIWEKFDRKFLKELWQMEIRELTEHHVEVQDSYHDLQSAASRAERYMSDIYKILKMKRMLLIEEDTINGKL